jgi:outer membrane protein assembly factor BamB
MAKIPLSSVLLVFLSVGNMPTWATGQAIGQPWARFRGPNGSGESEATTIPAQWTEADYNWRVELAGTGHSSPVVWEEHLYLMSANEADGTRIVQCLNRANGQEVWRRSFPSTTHAKHAFNRYATATPPVDGKRIYLSWATPDAYLVIALDCRTGEELWRRNLGPFVAEHGFGASPIVVDDLLIVPNDQDGPSSVVALDARNGQVRWQLDRRTRKTAYSTPCLYQPVEGPPQVILTSWAHGITSLELRTGKLHWELPVFQHRTVSSPIVVGGLIFATAGEGGSGKRLAVVVPGEPRAGAKPRVAYEYSGPIPYVPMPVARGNLVFLLADAGIVTCLDAPTGEVLWRERIGGRYFASPVRAGDRVYCLAQNGEMVVFAAASEFKLLGRVELGETSHATPAIADGTMYIRTLSRLMSIGGAKKQ